MDSAAQDRDDPLVCQCGHHVAHHVTTRTRHGCFPPEGCDCRDLKLVNKPTQDRFESHYEALGYTLGSGKLFVPIDVFHEWAERLLGRPIMTHEFAMHDTWDELREVFEDAAKVRIKEADPNA